MGGQERSQGLQLRNFVGDEMSELRKAAQTALEAWDRSRQWPFPIRPDKEFDALRAALAQPERKPLTDAEVYALVDATLEHGRCALARAIERAHGIGGEA